jgi:DNA mismatch repair protein MutS2
MRLKRETQIAEDLRIALEEEREATAMKYALLDIEAGKREKERAKEFTAQLSETLDSFEKQTKSFLQTIEDKALKAKMEKEILTRKTELKRFVFEHEVVRKVEGGKIQIPSAFAAEPKFKTENRPIVLGDKVLTSFNSIGIVEKIDGTNAEVLVGSMRMREKLKNLKVVAAESQVSSLKSQVKIDTQAIDERLETDNFTPELSLIGKRTSEAEYMLDKFLDESYMSSQRQIRIIHGFGTGAMRNFVQSFLRNHAHVSRYTFAEQNQGGEGATIVELKS